MPMRAFKALERMWLKIVFTLLSVIGITALRIMLTPLLGSKAQLLPYLLAVILSSGIGGFPFGILAVVLSTAAGMHFFVEPLHNFHAITAQDWYHIVLFFSQASLICWIVSRLRIARMAANQSTETLRTIVKHMPVGLLVVEAPTGKIILSNHELTQIFRHEVYPANGFQDYKLWTGFHENGGPYKAEEWPVARSVLTGEVVSGEQIKIKRGDGTDGIVSINSAPIFNHQKQIVSVVATVTDVSNLKEVEAQLRESKEFAEKSNDAKTQFLANMSHEIRTPVGSIMGFTELLKNSDISASDRKSFMLVIERNSQQLLRLIDDILDLSKVEAGKVVVEEINFDFAEFLGEFSSLMSFKAREKGIVFKVRIEGLVPQLIGTDQVRLRQILMNIVGNAIKFTEKGHVELLVRSDGPTLQFTVSDTGIGISSEQRQRIFQPFGQSDPSMTRRYGGTGLGLILSRRLAQVLGGDLRLDWSEEGQGSRFIASIKTLSVKESRMLDLHSLQSYESLPPPKSLPLGRLKGMKILVVDDSPDNRILLATFLRKESADVLMAENGRAGMEIALTKMPDIVLMDIQMPVMDGHEAIIKLRREGFSRPIIAITAHAMREERDRCFTSGCNDYLTKPINMKQLIDLLSRYLLNSALGNAPLH